MAERAAGQKRGGVEVIAGFPTVLRDANQPPANHNQLASTGEVPGSWEAPSLMSRPKHSTLHT